MKLADLEARNLEVLSVFFWMIIIKKN